MKKLLLLFVVMTILIPFKSSFPQTINDYISEVRGDTLVIKDYSEMNNQPNSLKWVLLLDTNDVPAGRVYLLQAGRFYPNTYSPTSSSKHPTVIVGSDPTMIVNNKNVASSPPLICTDSSAVGPAIGINAGGDLTIKNCQLVNTTKNGNNGVLFTNTLASNLHLVYDNCLFEHTAHWFVWIRNYSNENVTFRNCYFVNMNGQPCRRDGGVFMSFYNQDTLLVENCTHVMAQGSLYKFMIYPDNNPPFSPHDYQFKKIIFNHNTFVNCAGTVFMNPGYQSNVTLTSNIFINCNVQGFAPILGTLDIGEVDPDSLPMGLVNVYDSAEAPIKFYVDKNLIYNDPSLSDIDEILNTNEVNGVTNWKTQMITMNERTQLMFDNDTKYPYLIEGEWFETLPNFTDPQDLLTTQLTNLKAFALSTVDITSTAVLPDWRIINTGPDKIVYPDWPIPVDLSYNDSELLTGGIGSFPIGDLNWFPVQKAAWLAQRDYEYELLDQWLRTDIEKDNPSSLEFKLQQNYPNPFNPSTMISFTIPEAGYVTLKVYNTLGEEVATLLDGFKSAQSYEIKFDGTDLANGVYLYSLEEGNNIITKKMILLK